VADACEFELAFINLDVRRAPRQDRDSKPTSLLLI
jgi:hypothetical protein